MRHRGDEQATGHKEDQSHHEVESKRCKSNEAQVQPSDLSRIGKWQEAAEGQECYTNAKQQKVDQRSHQL
jgi:hypothetical protein